MINKMVSKCSCFNTDAGLLVLRIGLGAIFIFAGWQKVADLHGTVGMFASMGFAPFLAYLVSFVEFVGGICVLLGMFTRPFAVLLAITMLVAAYITRANPMMSMFPLSLAFSAVALTFSGSGMYSVARKMCGCGSCHMCANSDVVAK
jgi:putative oxidoreductase